MISYLDYEGQKLHESVNKVLREILVPKNGEVISLHDEKLRDIQSHLAPLE
jgi:hypothetical protein